MIFCNCFVEVKEFVIKAQVLAGGRGKGVFSTGFKGGVHLTKELVKPKICKLIIGEFKNISRF